jgi:hypothetical protein
MSTNLPSDWCHRCSEANPPTANSLGPGSLTDDGSSRSLNCVRSSAARRNFDRRASSKASWSLRDSTAFSSADHETFGPISLDTYLWIGIVGEVHVPDLYTVVIQTTHSNLDRIPRFGAASKNIHESLVWMIAEDPPEPVAGLCNRSGSSMLTCSRVLTRLQAHACMKNVSSPQLVRPPM